MNSYVGIDIGGTKMYMLAEHNNSYIEKTVPTGSAVQKEYIKANITDFIANLPFSVEGIGIAIPGLVDNDDTVIASDVVPCLDTLKNDYFIVNDSKVCFINDLKAALIEEASYYPEDYTLSVLMAGTGIAAATKTNGMMISGARNWAGELGFAPIAVDGKVYTVDSLSSGAAILQKAGTDVQTFLSLLAEADEKAMAIVNEAGFYFGLAVAFMINIFNPQVMVVGGSTSTYRGYLNTAIETASKYALKESFDMCTITTPHDPKRIVALGARKFAYKSDH